MHTRDGVVKTKPLDHHQRSFLYLACSVSGGALVLVASRLVSQPLPAYSYLFFFITAWIFLQCAIRYLVSARVYRAENTISEWILSALIALVEALTVWMCVEGSKWWLSAAILVLLGTAKTIQSKRAIRSNPLLSETRRVSLCRRQDGLTWAQILLFCLIVGCWVLTNTRIGDMIAVQRLGVSDLRMWHQNSPLLGGALVLIYTAFITVTVIFWHTDDLGFVQAKGSARATHGKY